MDGLEAEEILSWRGGEGEEGFPAASAGGPTVRKGVDAGTDVIDLAEMRAELEKRGGE